MDYYTNISDYLLRDYLVFFFSITLLAVAIGVYLGAKGYILAKRIELRMMRLQKSDKDNFISELAKIDDLCKVGDFESFFGPLIKVLDLYSVSVTNENGIIVYINETFSKATEYAPGELLGKRHDIISSSYHPSAFWQDMYRQIHNGRLWHGIIRNKQKSGTFFWADTTIIPLSMFSHMKGFITLRTDVSELFAMKDSIKDELRKKTAQLRDTEKLLEKTDRMATLGTLVASIAHEINNPLSYVSSNIFSLSAYMKNSSEIIGYLVDPPGGNHDEAELLQSLRKKIRKEKMDIAAKDAEDIIGETSNGIRHIRDIVHDLKLYSHSRQENFAEANINECIKRVVNIAKPEIKHRINMMLNLGNIPTTYCIENKIQQVILNLVINASQAIKDKGEITITTTMDRDSWIRISVADTGCGIATENIEKIYQAFFTTKPPGEGTGLGLAISSNIIQRHGGTLDCNSRMGEGTEFIILLPLAPSQPMLRLVSN